MVTVPSVPARLNTSKWRRPPIQALAKLLSLLVVTSCLINISFLGRHLGVQQPHTHAASPFSSLQRGRPDPEVHDDPNANISLPIVFVDDKFSAEDASYSESESEDEEEVELENEVLPFTTNATQNETVPINITSIHLLLLRNGSDQTLQYEIKPRLAIVEDDNATVNGDGKEETDDDPDGSMTLPIVDLLASNLTVLVGKHRVFSLLLEAGIDSLDLTTIRQLPEWDQISSLYYPSGQRPIIHGLDSCDTYRRTVEMDQRYLATAGLFNTGTNALSFLLRENIMMNKKAQWQVPWSKHRLLRISGNHTAPNMQRFNRSNVLPIVIIKDIFTWLQSMCKSPYEAHWKHNDGHCPNLVPNQWDLEQFAALQGHSTVPVRVKFSENQTIHWDSLVGLYNEWYREYYDATFPRLMVRFEDLLFAPEEMLQAIADCVGAELAPNIVYNTKSSKDHGSQTNLVGAMIKFGSGRGRLHNMTSEDVQYVNDALDKQLRTTFDYTGATFDPLLREDDLTEEQ